MEPKLIAFDLDGTLSQHKSPLPPESRATLDALGARYRLLMVGAGQCGRIFEQMGHYPIDIIGNYGLQHTAYDPATGTQKPIYDLALPCDRAACEERVTRLREKYGFTVYAGENVEYHPSGCVTFPILGTKAVLADKLAFDPDRVKRRAIYADVCATFPEYNVFVGGTSSFDMAPKPYDKYEALVRYCEAHGIDPRAAVFCGDDYGPGGNDEPVLRGGIPFIRVDDYRAFPRLVAHLLA